MKSTTRFSKNKKGIECLNCQQPISDNDNFCSNCGQVNDELPLSIKQFISEFFSGFFSFDSRFFKTFGPLLFKPGKVSKDYVQGKRRRYVSPFQLYLHVTIIFFLLQGLFATIDDYRITETTSEDNKEIAIDSTKITDSIFEKNNLKKDSTLIELPLFKTNDSLSISNPKEIQKDSSKKNTLKQKLLFRIDSIFTSTDLLDKLKSDTISKDEKDLIYEKFFNSNIIFISKEVNNDAKNDDWEDIQRISALSKDANNHVQEAFEIQEINYTIPEEFSLSIDDNIIRQIIGQKSFGKISDFLTYSKENKEALATDAIEDLGLEKTRWNAFYYRIAQNINKAKEDAEFRSTWGKSIISNISLALFLLLPIFTLFVSLIYIRHKWNYTEHLVFVFNIQTVFFLLLIFFNLFDRVFDTDIGIFIFILLFLFYLFKALRKFYEQHWFKTLVKFLLLNGLYYILSIVGLLIVSFISFIL